MVRVKENRKVIPVTTVGALLNAYDEHMRGLQPTPPAGVRYERDGPLLRAAGVTYLQADASADSAPILRRLGFRAVTTTTTYVWTPPQPTSPG